MALRGREGTYLYLDGRTGGGGRTWTRIRIRMLCTDIRARSLTPSEDRDFYVWGRNQTLAKILTLACLVADILEC